MYMSECNYWRIKSWQIDLRQKLRVNIKGISKVFKGEVDFCK